MIPIVLFKITNFAAACALPGKGSFQFFGFPHWWQYLKGEVDPLGKCAPAVNLPNDLWLIALAVVDMLLYLAGVVAVVSIIIAAINYIMTRGNVEKAVAARTRLVNSIVGLIIVITAVALVSFLGTKLA